MRRKLTPVVHDGPPCPCGCGRPRRRFGNGNLAKHHSQSCARKKKKIKGECPKCGVETSVTKGRIGYCNSCAKSVSGGSKKKAEKRAKKYVNGVRIGAYSKVKVSSCVWCGETFIARSFGLNKTHCSTDCVIKHNSQKKANVDSPVQCINCGTTYNKIYSPWVAAGSMTCSQKCQDERALEMEKASKRKHKAKRRAAEKNAGPHALFDPFDVFRRDRWQCQACGVDTPEDLRGTCEDTAPELDHVVPISKGGLHTMENCQLLCRKCNQEKSDLDNWVFLAVSGKSATQEVFHGRSRQG